MAVVAYGATVAALSGTVGGLNFCHGKYGDVVRRARGFVDRSTGNQLTQRATLARAGAAWQALTESQRAAYEATARRVSRVDRFGTKRPLTGWGLFSEVFLSFYPDWPFTGDGDIPGLISPPPSVYVEAWEQGGTLPVRVNAYKGGFHYADIQVSRPVSSKVRTLWGNWRRAFHDEIIGGWLDLGSPGSRAAVLEGLIVGERIGVRARVAELGATGYLLFSRWVETSTEVISGP